MTTERTAQTRSGKIVTVGKIYREDEHGFYSYVIHSNGFAVSAFIPKN
jgi:hypothetical protein